MRRYMMLLLGAMLFSVGCADQDPPYLAAIIAEDPGLLGVWVPVEEGGERSDDPTQIEFLSRQVKVDGDRLATGSSDGPLEAFFPQPQNGERLDSGTDDEGGPSHKFRTVEQFTVRMSGGDDPGVEFAAYLLKAGDIRLLGLQVVQQEEVLLALPVHMVFKIEREGDQFVLWQPQDDMVVWIPAIEPVDGVEDPAAPIERRESGGGGALYRVTSSIDRLAAYYTAHADDPDFWQEGDRWMKLVNVDLSQP